MKGESVGGKSGKQGGREKKDRRKKESGWTKEGRRDKEGEGGRREKEIGACKSTVKARNLNSLRFTLIAAQKSWSFPSRFARVIAASVAITAFDNDVARRLSPLTCQPSPGIAAGICCGSLASNSGLMR